jgi:hypothetical protein
LWWFADTNTYADAYSHTYADTNADTDSWCSGSAE